MYNYPFFSFPHFRKYPYYSNYVNHSRNVANFPSMQSPSYSSSKVSLEKKEPTFYHHDHYYSRLQDEYSRKKSELENKKEENGSKKAKTGFSFLDHFLHQEDRKDDEKYFEILGLKLYDDDILLLCLIFFLYKEDVKDPYLFIALVLLLLS